MGSPAHFEQIWAFLEHRGVQLSPTDLIDFLTDHWDVTDDAKILVDELLTESGARATPDWQRASWDPIERAYWELNPVDDEPVLDRVFRKGKRSVFDGLEYHLDGPHRKLLTALEEQRLGVRIEEGLRAQEELHEGNFSHDRRRELGLVIREADIAREEFTEHNLRLVVNLAKKYVRVTENSVLGLDDLIQAGYLGLLRAVVKIDPRRGFKFSTYATWWIRQAISRSIATEARTIRLPVHIVDKLNTIRRSRRRLLQELGHEPGSEEISVAGGLSTTDVERLASVGFQPLPLDAITSDTDSNAYQSLAHRNGMTPEDEVLEHLLRDYLDLALECLPDREHYVIAARFGLLDGQIQTLEEVGRHFGLTRERIRQLEKKGLAELRHPRNRLHLESYVELSCKPDAESGESHG